MNDADFTDTLKSLRNPPPEALTALRHKVLAAAAQERHPTRRPPWFWTAAVAACAVLVLGLAAARFLTAPVETPVPVIASMAPPRGWNITLLRRPTRPRPRMVIAAASSFAAQPLRIQMLTEDPNVVIIWLVDQGKDKRGESL